MLGGFSTAMSGLAVLTSLTRLHLDNPPVTVADGKQTYQTPNLRPLLALTQLPELHLVDLYSARVGELFARDGRRYHEMTQQQRQEARQQWQDGQRLSVLPRITSLFISSQNVEYSILDPPGIFSLTNLHTLQLRQAHSMCLEEGVALPFLQQLDRLVLHGMRSTEDGEVVDTDNVWDAPEIRLWGDHEQGKHY